MLQRDGVVMVEMEVLVMRMMVMMISMKSSAMMISPLREGISPADFCLPESFSLLVFSAPPHRGGGIYP
jgi:hypothetical protein